MMLYIDQLKLCCVAVCLVFQSLILSMEYNRLQEHSGISLLLHVFEFKPGKINAAVTAVTKHSIKTEAILPYFVFVYRHLGPFGRLPHSRSSKGSITSVY